MSTHSPKLRRNTLRLVHLIVMAIAAIAPVGCIFFNTIPQAGLVGAAIPLCYGIGFGIVLLIAPQMSEMAVELPNSGSWFMFVTQGLGAGWGFIAGWLGLVFYGVPIPFVLILMSNAIQTLLPQVLGIQLNWVIWYLLLTAIVWAVCYRGIRFSLQTDLVLLILELGVCLTLAFAVLVQLGSTGQLTIAPLTLSILPQNSNLFLGTILSILGFLERISKLIIKLLLSVRPSVVASIESSRLESSQYSFPATVHSLYSDDDFD